MQDGHAPSDAPPAPAAPAVGLPSALPGADVHRGSPRGPAEPAANGGDAARGDAAAGRASGESPVPAPAAPSPAPAAQPAGAPDDAAPAVRKKRRLDSELGFSSPGPAFQVQLEEHGERDESPGRRHSSRRSRPSRAALESEAYTRQRAQSRTVASPAPSASASPAPAKSANPPADAQEALQRCRDLREQLLRERLEQTHEEHDALVRELFHLTKFVTLMGYDPEMARQDQSEVFTNFQMHYDLASKVADDVASPGAGSSRSTRRATSRRLEALALGRPKRGESPTSPTTPPPPRQDTQRRGRGTSPARRASSTAPQPPARRASSAAPPTHSNVVLVPLSSGATLDPTHLPAVPPALCAARPVHGSLGALLASYGMWGDEVLPLATREQRIERETNLYRRLDAAQRQGRALAPRAPMQQQLRPHEAPRGKAHRDHLLEAVTAGAQRMRQQGRAHVQLARKVSRMVAAYWERSAHSDEREQKIEWRRQRALAKWTMREVSRQWKLAVTVIRARKQSAAQAERDKLGKKQLQAIIEQSTHMLETQHAELRGESDEEGEEEEEEGGEDEGEEDGEDENEEEGEEEGEEEDEAGTADEGASASGTSPSAEDAQLEQSMWEEDEPDEDEDADLAADADMPLEELLKKYRYDEASAAAGDGGDGGDEAMDVEESGEPSDHSPDEVKAQPGDADDAEAQPNGKVGESRQGTEAQEALSSAGKSESASEAGSDAGSGASEEEPALQALVAEQSSERPLAKIRTPFLFRGTLRPYQQMGLEWMVSLYKNQVNGILADEMGLGKTIQTIALFAHLACERGVWGPHLIVAPTSVMLNWEMEFKKFLPGFKILSYFGSQKERKAKRVGWNTENSFHVCITSYQLVLADQHIFRRKPWMYMVLDEAHNIKNFRSQRWQTLLGFNSQRRLLLTGTPLQNNLMDLWSLMYFLMPQGIAKVAEASGAFSNMRDFQDWFSNPLNKAVESGQKMDDETLATIAKLHMVLRPYVLRRLKTDVEQELPHKYEHIMPCRLSKRQRFLYNDFMSRAKTRESLSSGNYMSIINCLMQLRKVCNHPDLFEPRPIVTPFAQSRSVAADYEIKDLLVRRRLLADSPWDHVDLDQLNLRFTHREPLLTPLATHRYAALDASDHVAAAAPPPRAPPPPCDTSSIAGLDAFRSAQRAAAAHAAAQHKAALNRQRCAAQPVYGRGVLDAAHQLGRGATLLPGDVASADRRHYFTRCDALHSAVQSYEGRSEAMRSTLDHFAFATPPAMAPDVPQLALPGIDADAEPELRMPSRDPLHKAAVSLNVAFPDASLLLYDCGKLQQLAALMRRLTAEGHRVLIFTQMTRVLDILEKFFNYQGYRYLRLDGATRVEQRQALTERFNRDPRISAFILSTRSGGLGINLVGADTVVFYDLDWNAAIEAQCMDRAHRIGQTRDVHIYRFVSEHTIEENMLRKANQKRLLDNVVIQQGEFTTENLLRNDWRDMLDEGGTSLAGVHVGDAAAGGRDVDRALLAAEDEEDAAAARVAHQEMQLDAEDFAADESAPAAPAAGTSSPAPGTPVDATPREPSAPREASPDAASEDEDAVGSIDDYMLRLVEADWEFFGR